MPLRKPVFSRFSALLGPVAMPLALVNLASFVSQIIQIGVIDTLLPLALTNAGLGERHGGMMLSLYWLADLIGGFFVAAILRKTHPVIPLLISGVSFFTLIVVVMVAPQSFWVLPATLFAGLGLILRWVVCDGLIVQLAPANKVGRVVGFHETLMGLGIVLGPILIGWLGDDARMMSGLALAAAIIALLCGFAFPRLEMASTKKGAGATLRRWIDHWDLVLIAFVAGFVEICFLSVLPLQAQRDTGLADAGLWLAAIFVFGGTICQPVIGYLSDKGGPVKLAWLCFALLLAGAVPLALSGYGVFAGMVQFAIGMAVAGLYTAAVLIAASGRGEQGYQVGVLVLVSQSYTLGAIVGPSAGTALLVMIGGWALPVLVLTAGSLSVLLLSIRHMTERVKM
ncbi:MFS transporter [Thalassospira sp. TSL5-1]|uniref:MFS transporter n=1 Tax=Thalassospira sp. TSL5-1 TaxID=1544451 RepID=UPI000939C578|nr:MFS transporter [Thalassospira sp. TSL5-1]OKH89373.1 MFS transporter [Thalassospira sp. TSL5-1]